MRISITVAKNVSENFPVVLRGKDLLESLRKAKEYGYSSVELHLEDIELKEFLTLTRVIEQEDIHVSALGTGLAYVKEGLSFSNKDDFIRKEAVKRVKKFVEVASFWGSKVIIGSIRGRVWQLNEKEIYIKLIIDSFKEVLDEAEKNRVTLLVEPLNRYETNFINKVEEGLEFIKNLSSEYLKLHLDTFHMNIEEDNIKEAIEKAKSFVKHFHFADNQRKYPGSGHINFEEIREAIINIGYSEYIGIECLPLPNAETVAKESLKFLRGLFLS